MQMLVFEVAAARYAIPLARVREIVRAVAISPLPGSPAVVAGVVDLRGEAVPVFDLRLRFGAPPRELDPDERFVIARTTRRTVGLRVDAVEMARDVPEADVQAVDALISRSPYFAGVVSTADGLLLIQDLDTFLSAAEAEGLDGSLVGAAREDAG